MRVKLDMHIFLPYLVPTFHLMWYPDVSSECHERKVTSHYQHHPISCVFVCLCVCLICKDVKLRFWFFTSYAGGCRECHSSAANEDGYDILWYRSGTLDRRTCQFSGMGRGSTLEPPCRFVSISLQRTKLHQNPPQSKDVESTLGTICLHDRRQHRRRQLFIG